MKSRVAVGLVAVLALLGWSFLRAASDEDTQSLAGKAAPDFTLKTLDGKEVTLSDQKGSVVLLDFWATWCPPCRRALPHIQKLSADRELAEKGLKVYAVNARETRDKIEPFMKENSYTFSVPMDETGKTMEAYKVRGIPTTVVVGRDGKIRNVFVGFGGEESARRVEEAVKAALKEPNPAG